MSETVIRQITKDVWIFSCPFKRFGVIPVGGRSTVVRLTNDDLWVLASTPLNDSTKAKISELGGRVRYIVGPDAVHSLYLSGELAEFKTAYPEAKLIGVPEHLSKSHLKEVKFDGVYGQDPEGTKYGFEDEIQACYFSGFVNKDVAFNHIASRSLIVADLLFNLPATEQFSKSKSFSKFPFASSLTPFSSFHKRFLWSAGVDKGAMTTDAKTVAGWDFDRIIPCHGDVIETGGKNAWTEAFKWYLEKK